MNDSTTPMTENSQPETLNQNSISNDTKKNEIVTKQIPG